MFKTLFAACVILPFLVACGGSGGGGGSKLSDAGADQTVNEGARVLLKGVVNGPYATAMWTQTSGPAVTIVNGDQPDASFDSAQVPVGTTDVLGFAFTVVDDEGNASTDTVRISVKSNDFIVYIAIEGGTGRTLWRADTEPGGNPPAPLTTLAQNDEKIDSYAVSPDGSRVAYSYYDASASTNRMVIENTDGSGTPIVLDTAISTATMRWAPDGSRIAWLSWRDSPSKLALFTALPSGSDITRMYSPYPLGEYYTTSFKWAPDSTRLAYTVSDVLTHTGALYSDAPTGGANVQHTGTIVSDGDVGRYDWSPDSARLSVRGDLETDGVRELYLGQATLPGLTKLVLPNSPGYRAVSYEWAPNSSRIAFTAQNPTEGFDTRLYTAPATGGVVVQMDDPLNAIGTIQGFRWSPDSVNIAFLGDFVTAQSKELFVANATSGARHRVNHSLPPEGHVGRFEWAVSSSRLVYTASEEHNLEPYELFSVPALGGTATKLSNALLGSESVESIKISPDGSQVAYAMTSQTSYRQALFVTSVSSNTTMKLSADMVVGGGLSSFYWSHDSSYLSYTADQQTDDDFELYIVPRDRSAEPRKASHESNLQIRVTSRWWQDAGYIRLTT